jgi:DNA-directed RNA polymerase specialized sigma24 family protein
MSTTNKQVESILKSYNSNIRELKALRFELKRQQRLIDARLVEDLVFAHTDADRVSRSRVSDKTADIAIEHADSQRGVTYQVLTEMIQNISLDVERLEYYLSLLPQMDAEVIRLYYFDELGWVKIAERINASIKTAQRRRTRGVGELARYYSIMDKLPTHADAEM